MRGRCEDGAASPCHLPLRAGLTVRGGGRQRTPLGHAPFKPLKLRPEAATTLLIDVLTNKQSGRGAGVLRVLTLWELKKET